MNTHKINEGDDDDSDGTDGDEDECSIECRTYRHIPSRVTPMGVNHEDQGTSHQNLEWRTLMQIVSQIFKQELSSRRDGRPCQSKMGRKVGAAVLVPWSPSNTMWPCSRLTLVPSGILIIQPFGRNRRGPKSGRLLSPLFVGGGAAELGSHLTQCRLGRGLPPY